MRIPSLPKLALAATAALAVAAPAAQADSISFLRGGDIWLATPDGQRQVQVTKGGGYSFASQADDGTLLGLFGRRLHRIDPRTGAVTADFTTPVSFDTGPDNSFFQGPFDPVISPDGTKVAYEYYWKYLAYDPTCDHGRGCIRHRIEAGIGYSHSDRQTGWDEPGLGRQSGWLNPSWIDDGSLLLSDPSVRFGNPQLITDTMGDGTQTITPWFSDEKSYYMRDAEMTRAKDKLAIVGGDGLDEHGVGNYREDDEVRVYRLDAPPPAVPGLCFSIQPVVGKFESPSWSPDGTRIAYGDQGTYGGGEDTIHVADVPAGCGTAPQPRTILTGARIPDWGPADVPAVVDGQGGGGGGTQDQGGKDDGRADDVTGGSLTFRATTATRRKGITLKVTVPAAGDLQAVARKGRTKVASGSTTVLAPGKATIRLKLSAKGRRALRGKGKPKVEVTVTFRPGAGGKAAKATAKVTLAR